MPGVDAIEPRAAVLAACGGPGPTPVRPAGIDGGRARAARGARRLLERATLRALSACLRVCGSAGSTFTYAPSTTRTLLICQRASNGSNA